MTSSSEEKVQVRRTRREKKPSLKAMESLYATKLKSGGFVASVSSSDEEQFIFSDDEDDFTPEKPKLLHEDERVKGDEMFTFPKRNQRASLSLKVSEMQKTPHALRSKIKSKLKMVFEDSGSEYEVSGEESSDSELSEISEKSDKEEDEKKQIKNKPKENIKFDDTKAKVSSRGRRIKQNSKYTIDTDEYFANSTSGKIKTSNNTLDKLQTPRLPQYELQKLLLNNRFSNEHFEKINDLTTSNQQQFEKWLYVLHQNISILLYGLGSKKSILSSFQEECLKHHPVIVINGFFPTLSIKNIVDSFIEDLFELDENPSNLNQAVELILQEAQTCSNTYFFLLINNIEGIRGAKAQSILATLASVPNICLVATIDHINAPLIWDHKKLSKFNFTWWDVTSYLTYQHETECEMSSMTQQNSSLALSSLRNVFLSLTQNSKAIYSKIANYQIENSGQYYQGMAFKDLYKACRESFIVSSDLALRAQLSEFLDHKMVKTKRSLEDGTEYLLIPLAKNVLQKFMDEIS